MFLENWKKFDRLWHFCEHLNVVEVCLVDKIK